MNTFELTQLGAAAFGVHWRAPLAEALKCSREIVWRWEHGHNIIPAKRADHIRQVCAKAMRHRIKEIERALLRIELA